jgi:hypothetical protein
MDYYKGDEMIDLEEYRQKKAKEQEEKYQSLGIVCPDCLAELKTPKNGVVYTTNPPQIEVVCLKCGFNGLIPR